MARDFDDVFDEESAFQRYSSRRDPLGPLTRGPLPRGPLPRVSVRLSPPLRLERGGAPAPDASDEPLVAARSAAPAKEEQLSWIEVALVGDDDRPVPGEPYEITLADGTRVAHGTLDQNGSARIEGMGPGSYSVSFPRLDKDAWERA